MSSLVTDVWTVIAPPHARDGDSLHLLRERQLFRDASQILIQRDPKPVLCRVAWINTPEISGPKADPVGGPAATRDAQLWLDTRWAPEVPLVVFQYGFEKYGRPLVDVQTPGGESLSQWMLRHAGWPPYK